MARKGRGANKARLAAIRKEAVKEARRYARNKKRGGGGGGNGAVKNGGWASANIRTKGIPRPVAINHTDKMACCVLRNPFSPDCMGCKYPDGMNGRSIPLQIRGLQSFAVDSGGYLFRAYFGSLPYPHLNAASRSGGTFTLNGAYEAGISVPTLFTNNTQQYRIVCWGVRLTVTSSVPNTSGQLILTTTETSDSMLGQTYVSGTMSGQEVHVMPLTTGAQATWVSRRVGTPKFNNSGDTSTVANTDWTGLILDVSGGVASATTLCCEVVFNVEFQPNNAARSAGLSYLAPADPPRNAKAIDIAAKTSARTPAVIEGTLDKFAGYVEKQVQSAFARGGEYLLEGVAGLFV